MARIHRLLARARSVDAERADALLALVVTIGAELEILLGHRPDRALGAALAPLMTVPVAFRRRAPLELLALMFVAANVQQVGGGHAFDVNSTFVAFVAVIYSVGANCGGRRLGAAVVLMLAGFAGLIAQQPHGEIAGDIAFIATIAAGAPLAGGIAMRNRHRLTDELAAESARLARERDRRAQAAVAAERGRIAGELHDVIAHSVSVMVVQAAAARRLVEHDPERAHDAIAAIEGTGREALGEMRRLLGVLRKDDEGLALAPQPSLARLDELVRRTRAGGLDVALRVEGTPARLAPGLDVAAYRVVQEALAEAAGRGPGGRGEVLVRHTARAIEIEVNTVPGRAPGDDHDERLLIGMRERVALFGGELSAGRRRGGAFTLSARLPIAEATA